MSGVALVQFSNLDLGRFLPLGRKAFDRNLAHYSDAAGNDPPLHHMLCVASIKSKNARTAPDAAPYLNMFHAGFMVAAHELDWPEILEVSSMPCILSESIDRSIMAGVLAGDLLKWKSALYRGCQPEVNVETRHTFNLIYHEFKRVGLSQVFEFKTKESRDHTFLLEHK